MSRIERKYTYVIVGFSGLVIQEITIRLVPALSKVVKSPNWLTALNILLAVLICMALRQGMYPVAGGLIILTLFIDLTDGYLARYMHKASDLGAFFDLTADMVVWIATLIGIHLVTMSPYPFYIFAVYILEVHGKWLIEDKLSPLSEARGTAGEGMVSTLRRFARRLSLLFNPFDSMTVLALILFFDNTFIGVWLIYELIRRSLGAARSLAGNVIARI